ncbi:5-methyltetrahydropteroyltriglutamate--homocysteine S-methyltransferase [Metabacillus sediminilitoris]|uniref:5-methyltetrahydropteroyltriglutamate--homocysteine methyltransferase n=1 Tax=Metabacillus sediminilitoris TaxID=2567941 RepID=A0A4S4C197_9BACI|nr:5-methyltetrahydropteroyltriglutamate--homocysteine S-methyltransferase [Metabacillus sediminilitoris]QGQ46246.1 5-methyltetrahydropteroyltriglutamate--homocysteine S-methyltransferase [Metabacillus sediminilitoris]THF79298.1 5-methyltetrahydropteroyltriglutamate--homocysteine S-methyltransferase [Metabacillus sediminilitoris]
MKIKNSNIGYPRIGENREWKRVLELFWSDQINEEQFNNEMVKIRLSHLEKQQEKGIDLIPIGDFSYYDQVLDTAVMFGLIPERFKNEVQNVTLKTYFEIARGSKGKVAAEMTKWFNTNYHYIVPELEHAKPRLLENRILSLFQEAKEKLGINGKPVILGPITLLSLSKGYNEQQKAELLHSLIPLYLEVFNQLKDAGAKWIQIDEPILVKNVEKDLINEFKEVYTVFHEGLKDVNIILQTYFEKIEFYEEIIQLPVQGIGLDFVHDDGGNLEQIKKHGFPSDKVLFAGVIDGRNIWKANLVEKSTLLSTLTEFIDEERLFIQPSCSLLHVPVTVKNEHYLDTQVKNGLSFADEKLEEVVLLTNFVNKKISVTELDQHDHSIRSLKNSAHRNVKDVKEKLKNLKSFSATRIDAAERKELHENRWNLPILPTTTIGSFPQTKEVRSQRLKWRKGELSNDQYEEYIKKEIKKWIEIQEELGLDVLVHGEFERTDMVEFFGEKLEGVAITKFGWVQSYGSRCVKPPVIFGDVYCLENMTVKETVYAQSLTKKPVKGMLTGPVTIVNWSFVRDDISRVDVLNQVALAIRKEVEALEENGITMIQVDEAALREGLPLKEEKTEDYLNAAVYAFKLATSSVNDDTQIHTHMCYSNFDDIIHAIDALDADVISIETSRSHGELITSFEQHHYNKGIGLGVYDIHSPRVPTLEELSQNIKRALEVLDYRAFWVNPDCGLKTRGEVETVEAIKVMVKAAQIYREKLNTVSI